MTKERTSTTPGEPAPNELWGGRFAAGPAEAMQRINRTVLNLWFLGAFFGAAAIGALLAGYALWDRQQPGSAWLLAGGLLYVLGTFLVTVAFNVPMNEALAKAEASSGEAARLWARYLKRWTAWNHVRTIACVLGLISFILALRDMAF